MIKRVFTEHPASVGESYTQHMGMAFGFGGKMVFAGLACLLHGIFPFLFTRTGRNCIEDLHYRMVTHRDCRTHGEKMSSVKGAAKRLQAAE